MGTVIHDNFTGIVYLAGYPQKNRDRDGAWTSTYRFYVHADELNDFIPEKNAVDPETGMPCSSVKIQCINGFPDIREVTVEYSPGEGGGDWNGSDNDINYTLSSDCQRQERNIESHPDWSSYEPEDQKKIKKMYPAFTFISATFTITEQREKANFKMTESILLDGIDSVGAPPKLSGANPEKWKKISRRINFTGEYVEISDIWAYDKNGWNNLCGVKGELAKILEGKNGSNPTALSEIE